jgi:hypothetical protein
MVRKGKFENSAARAMAMQSGIVFEGSARDWANQAAALTELDRLTFAYEKELGVRGMLFDRAGAMLKSRFADEAREFTTRHANLAADLTLGQAGQSLELTRQWAAEARDFEIRNASTSAKADLRYTQTQGAMGIASSILGNTAAGLGTARLFGWF